MFSFCSSVWEEIEYCLLKPEWWREVRMVSGYIRSVTCVCVCVRDCDWRMTTLIFRSVTQSRPPSCVGQQRDQGRLAWPQPCRTNRWPATVVFMSLRSESMSIFFCPPPQNLGWMFHNDALIFKRLSHAIVCKGLIMMRCLHLPQAGPPCRAPLGPLWGALSNRMSSGAARLPTRVQRATLHNLHYAAVQLQRPLPAGWPEAVITVSSLSFFSPLPRHLLTLYPSVISPLFPSHFLAYLSFAFLTILIPWFLNAMPPVTPAYQQPSPCLQVRARGGAAVCWSHSLSVPDTRVSSSGCSGTRRGLWHANLPQCTAAEDAEGRCLPHQQVGPRRMSG